MSTLKVTNIESPSGGGVNAKITDINGGQLSNRNLIINGAMVIDQRNDGSSVTVNSSTNYFAADRFKFGISSSPTGAGTLQQVSDGPDGFVKSNKFTVTTADSSIPATQSYNLMQEIEGQNVSNLAWGSSAAKTITFSFYVKTSLNGTFGGSIQNSARDRSYPFTYSISSSEANTWVRREITVVGDTSGTWLTTNGVGLRVLWGIGNGSSRTASAGAWTGSDARGATGQVQVIGTNSATFQVTGVQLEVGEVATAFEHRSVSDELARCERYFEVIGGRSEAFMGYAYSSSAAAVSIRYRTVKRAIPGTITLSAAGQSTGQLTFLTAGGSYPSSTGNNNVEVITAQSFRVGGASYTGLNANSPSSFYVTGSAGATTTIAKVDAEP